MRIALAENQQPTHDSVFYHMILHFLEGMVQDRNATISESLKGSKNQVQLAKKDNSSMFLRRIRSFQIGSTSFCSKGIVEKDAQADTYGFFVGEN